jgi:hypothetical protein
MAGCGHRILFWSSGLSWGRREKEGVEGGLRCAHEGLPLLYRNRLLLLPQDKPTRVSRRSPLPSHPGGALYQGGRRAGGLRGWGAREQGSLPPASNSRPNPNRAPLRFGHELGQGEGGLLTG